MIRGFAARPDDSEELTAEKTAILLVAGTCSIAGFVWFGMYAFVIGWNFTTVLPLSFTAIVGSGLVAAHLLREHRIAIYLQIVSIIGVTYLIQWTFGGLFDSGLVLLWAFLGPLVALMFRSKTESLGWFGVFFLLLVGTVVFDDRLAENTLDISDNTQNGLLLMNLGVMSAVVFGFTGYYVTATMRQRAAVSRLLNSTVEGIYGIDLDGVCTFANPACVRLLGYDGDRELIGENVDELVHRSAGESRILEALRAGRGTHSDDEQMWRKQGEGFRAEYWSFPIEENGNIIGAVVTFIDITERKTIEEELRQTEKMAALGKLSAGLAHELNNPAAAATRASGQLVDALADLQAAAGNMSAAGIGSSEWAALIKWDSELRGDGEQDEQLSALERSDREDELAMWLEGHGISDSWELAPTLVDAGMSSANLDDLAAVVSSDGMGATLEWWSRYRAAVELAGVVGHSSSNISSLVESVKSYSYMDQAPLQEVDIHQGIEDTLRILNHRLGEGIEVVREFDRELPRIEVRGSELNQVWTNLIDNSIEAVGERGTITLRTFGGSEGVGVEVQDNGPGIPEELQSRIFDPFFTTKDVGEGVGLGLDVTRRIVTERCGGEISFTSQPGETKFRVLLPTSRGEPG